MDDTYAREPTADGLGMPGRLKEERKGRRGRKTGCGEGGRERERRERGGKRKRGKLNEGRDDERGEREPSAHSPLPLFIFPFIRHSSASKPSHICNELVVSIE